MPRARQASGRVDGVFGPDDRIVVGEGDAFAAELFGSGGDGLRQCLAQRGFNVAAARHGPVLAELAAQVAAGRAEREDRRARIELVERFLFDRIDAEAGAASVGGRDDPPVPVLAHEAEPPFARLQRTVPRAKIADQSRFVV